MGNQSAVVVLLDFSQTFAPYDDADVAALKQLGELIARSIKDGSLKQPTKVLWAGFGDDGLTPLRPCGPAVVFAQRLTTASNSSPDMLLQSKMPDFEEWLNSCPTFAKAVSNSAQPFTDVSGAFAFADDAVQDATENRLVLIYSDMLEDLPDKRERTQFELHGAKVAIVWRTGRDDREQPADVRKRVEKWSETLKRKGSSVVCNFQAQSVTTGDLLSCLAGTAHD